MDFDAAIIGAGPAGCAAAIDLARRKWRVALLEKQRFPRDKLCGEFISPDGISDLSALGALPALSAWGASTLTKARLTFPTACDILIDFASPGWGLSRRALDATLFDLAGQSGAVCFERSWVRSVTGDLQEGFQVISDSADHPNHSFHAKAVIAATGRWSNIPPNPLPPSPRRIFLGLKAHFRGTPDFQNAVQLHFFEQGYCGLNRVENHHINLCALVTEEFARRFSKNWDELLQVAGGQNKSLQEMRRGITRLSDYLVTSPVIFTKREKIIKDMLMVGDAAGVLDPFSGDGISSGLRSGLLAADCIHRFLKKQDSAPAAKQRYLHAYRAEFKRRFLFSQIVRHALAVPALPQLFSPLQSRIPRLGQWLVQQTRGQVRP